MVIAIAIEAVLRRAFERESRGSESCGSAAESADTVVMSVTSSSPGEPVQQQAR